MIIALDLKTGKLRWDLQTVHHDQWECDRASPPILYNVRVKGKLQRGLHVTCKNGYAYHLDRANGEAAGAGEGAAGAERRNDGRGHACLRRKGGLVEDAADPAGRHDRAALGQARAAPGPPPDGKPYEYSCTFANVGPDHFVAHMVSISGATNYWPAAYNAKLGTRTSARR